jgi:hypothetical protein
MSHRSRYAGLAVCALVALGAGAARAEECTVALARAADGVHASSLGSLPAARPDLAARENRLFDLRRWLHVANVAPAPSSGAQSHPSILAVLTNTLRGGAAGPATVVLPSFVGRLASRAGVRSSLLLSRPGKASAAGHEVPAGLALARKLP